MSDNNTTQAAGSAIRGVGCLILILLAAGFALYACTTSKSSDTTIDTWWDSQTAVSRAAYCGSVQRDPSFNGGAIGMADAIGDTSVDQYDTKKFLLDVCFPQ
jgi:hypothetical protein